MNATAPSRFRGGSTSTTGYGLSMQILFGRNSANAPDAPENGAWAGMAFYGIVLGGCTASDSSLL